MLHRGGAVAANSRMTVAVHALAWMALAPEEITLLAVYDAVGQEPPFGLHHGEPNLECPVGLGIRPALSQVYDGIEQAMRRELADVSVADVLRETLKVR